VANIRDKPAEDAPFELTERVWLLFENDWWMTRESIPGIADDATFLNPKVEDESNNWANRGHFLAAYREARDLLKARGRDPEA
jgi:hypothetical protein